MKKIVALLIVLFALCSVANAETAAEIVLELENMAIDDLHFLKRAINAELIKRSETKDGEEFIVEHNEAYCETRQYIWDFLKEKGYEVQTILGVPNIGRYEDENPDDLYVGWYAFINHNGEWREYVVLLFAGEVVSAMPNKSK